MRLVNIFALFSYAVLATATTYNATFTWYGTGDKRNSGNCTSIKHATCGWYTSPGFSASVSQNIYGTTGGEGPYCGRCLKLNPVTAPNGTTLKGAGKDVVVQINNLCPATPDNPLCAQTSLTSKNEYGGFIDVNVCSDSGAKSALFGTSGSELAVGTAEEVDCKSWNGTRVEPSSAAPSKTGSTATGSATGTTPATAPTGSSGAGKMVTLSWVGLLAVIGIAV